MPGTSIQTGLTGPEAARRLAEAGPNVLPQPRGRSLGTLIAGTVREPMFFLLLAAAGIYLMLGDLGEGLFMLAGAGMAVALVILQEARSERALSALRNLAEPFATVIRDGRQRRLPARDLAPGDIFLVSEGERLAADALFRSGGPVEVDESVLTGESVPVSKTPQDFAGGNASTDLFAGTVVTQGNGLAEVTVTGAATAFGRIGASLAAISDRPTPLQKAARRLTGTLGVVALVVCLLTALAYGVFRGDWVGGALSGLTLSIALIPEEFPMVLTVFMALGAWRLARRRVLVRRSAAIEALGAASVLCVDKTGTLTENRMRLARLWTEAGDGDADLLAIAALASDETSSDPMDRAIVASRGSARPEMRLERSWPLTPERLAVVRLWRDAGQSLAAAKGAPEAVFRLCAVDGERLTQLRFQLELLAKDGLRVLAVAQWRGVDPPDGPDAMPFSFMGFLGFADPIRLGVPDALAKARAAGVAVVMVTGDYPATALAIARQAGFEAAEVVTGDAFAAMTPVQRRDCVATARVFARVRPEQKLLLVEAFRGAGEVVAMTGDGVNDAPALESADIGIAMGRRGTDVAREAADIVLLDDDFASLVGAVRLGRRIFANLRKALVYIIAIHLPIAGLALLPVLLGLPPLLLPMHLVPLELVIDPVCSVVFEAEPGDRRSMLRPPRPPSEPLFGLRQGVLAIGQGTVLALAVLLLYVTILPLAAEAQARACALVALVLGNLTLALADSAAGASLAHRSRRAFWAIACAAAAILALIVFAPGVNTTFGLAPPPAGWLGLSALTGLVAGGWFGLAQWLLTSRSGAVSVQTLRDRP